MKRVAHLFEKIASPANLLSAFLKARRGKGRQAEVRAFAAHLDGGIAGLRQDLLAGRCHFDRYESFRIHDPKERIIHAAPFRDRVLHHAIMNVCEPFFERLQIFDSYACRKGKGTRAALFRVREFSRRYPWYLKLDVRRYFPSIGHERLKRQLARLFKDPRLLALFEAVIDGFATEPGKGLPIGNLTSQYFANHYLAPLDHFVKERLRVPGYLRYMDDFVLWGHSTRDLAAWEGQVCDFCAERLGLELKVPCLNRSRAGLPFLGFVVRPGGLRLSSRSCRRVRRKLRACLRDLERGRLDEDRAAKTVRSLFARTDWASGPALRRRLSADDFGRRPRARTASTAAVAGSTTRGTAAVPTATGTGTRATATTTWASAWSWPPAQESGRTSSVDPGGDPVSMIPHGSRDEACHGGRVPVARAEVRVERSRPPFSGETTGKREDRA
jgi:RNA-directed DNA polymerase